MLQQLPNLKSPYIKAKLEPVTNNFISTRIIYSTTQLLEPPPNFELTQIDEGSDFKSVPLTQCEKKKCFFCSLCQIPNSKSNPFSIWVLLKGN